MGNKGHHAHSEDSEEKSNKKKETNLRASTDWRLHGKDESEKQENPALIDVEHLLRYTKTKVNYDEDFTPDRIRVEKIPVPGGYLLHNVLSEAECKQYIEISEEMGYEVSPLRILDTVNSNQFTLDKSSTEIRNSLRVLFDASDEIGRVLNERILPHLPPTLVIDGVTWCVQQMDGGLAGCPLNKRWRFNKYHVHQFFKPHFDAGYVYDKNEQTVLTFILYLNDVEDGGETTFYPDNKKSFHAQPIPGIEFSVRPERGKALIFLQTGSENPRHEGRPHTREGQFKYILRTDIAYYRRDRI